MRISLLARHNGTNRPTSLIPLLPPLHLHLHPGHQVGTEVVISLASKVICIAMAMETVMTMRMILASHQIGKGWRIKLRVNIFTSITSIRSPPGNILERSLAITVVVPELVTLILLHITMTMAVKTKRVELPLDLASFQHLHLQHLPPLTANQSQNPKPNHPTPHRLYHHGQVHPIHPPLPNPVPTLPTPTRTNHQTAPMTHPPNTTPNPPTSPTRNLQSSKSPTPFGPSAPPVPSPLPCPNVAITADYAVIYFAIRALAIGQFYL